MYKIKDKVYADIGKILKGDRIITFQSSGELSDFTEEAINIDDMHVENGMVVFNNGMFRWIVDDTDYGVLKKRMISLRYNTDSQIAIMLNKEDSEEDLRVYNKMQEWRDWASVMAHKIQQVLTDNEQEL